MRNLIPVMARFCVLGTVAQWGVRHRVGLGYRGRRFSNVTNIAAKALLPTSDENISLTLWSNTKEEVLWSHSPFKRCL